MMRYTIKGVMPVTRMDAREDGTWGAPRPVLKHFDYRRVYASPEAAEMARAALAHRSPEWFFYVTPKGDA